MRRWIGWFVFLSPMFLLLAYMVLDGMGIAVAIGLAAIVAMVVWIWLSTRLIQA